MALRAVTEHPKFANLKRILGRSKGATLGYLECMWHFTGKYTPQGNIGKYSAEEIEAWVEWDGEPGAMVAAMVKSRWLDQHPEHGLVVHDWHKHADDATRLALKRAGLPFCVPRESAPCPDSVATGSGLPEPEPVPEPVSENPSESPSDLTEKTAQKPRPTSIEPLWEEFCVAYPQRAGDLMKAKGRDKFALLLKSGVQASAMIDGARRYCEWCNLSGNSGTAYVKQMTTWLNNSCWLEDYSVSNQKPRIIPPAVASAAAKSSFERAMASNRPRFSNIGSGK